MKLRNFVLAVGMTAVTLFAVASKSETKVSDVLTPHEYCHATADMAKRIMRLYQNGVPRSEIAEFEDSGPLGKAMVDYIYTEPMENTLEEKQEAVDDMYYSHYDMCRQELRGGSSKT